MKHFLVVIDYLLPVETLGGNIQLHREFLQSGYDHGRLLLSGPRVPATGGIVIARAKSLAEITDFFSHDPYAVLGLAKYTFYEFSPVKHQKFLQDWINSESL